VVNTLIHPRLLGLPLVGDGDSRLYTFCRFLAVPLFGGLYGCRCEGVDNLPRSGPVIVACNHKSLADPVVAGMVCHRPLRYMAKKELFVNPYLRRLITSLGAFPLDRGAGDREALVRALDILEEGGLLLMFPEGTRQTDDAIHKFFPGAGMIAVRSGAPVVPLAMDGTQRMLPPQGGVRLTKLRTAIGRPIDLSDLTARNSRTYQEAARRMQRAVTELYAGLWR
jgi:1-acyl-sn-glycerol-3-phosphate acyltransferase